jgi:hypothetical protein
MQKITNKPLFDLGRLVATAGALAALEKTGQNAVEFLARHVTGDWGELRVEDAPKIDSACSRASVCSAVTELWRATNCGSSPKPTAPQPPSCFPKNIDSQRTKSGGKRTDPFLARAVREVRPRSQLNCRIRVFNTTGDFFCRAANFSALSRSM